MKHLTCKTRSVISEKALAKRLGGKVQPASGALPVKSLKADVKTPTWLIDDKTTGKQSYSIKLSDWRKLRKQAWQNRRMACLHINFEEGASLFVIDEQAFKRFNDCIENPKS